MRNTIPYHEQIRICKYIRMFMDNNMISLKEKESLRHLSFSSLVSLFLSSRGSLGGSSGLSGSLNSLTGILSVAGVDLSKLVGIKLGSLEELDLADEDVVDGVDTDAALLDLLGDNLRDELVDKLVEAADGSLTTHDLHHTLADQVLTTRLSVGGKRMALVTNGVLLLGGEGNAEHTNDATVKSLHIDVSLDKRLPLADKGLETIVGEIHAVEVSKATTTIDLVYTELHLPVGAFLILLEVSEVGLEHTALKSISSDLKTDGLVHAGLANLTVGKVVGSDDIVPLLAKEGILCTLAAKLLSGLQLLVLANCHFCVCLLP